MELRTFTLPGVRCGNCESPLTRVSRTITTQGLVIRERLCEACGKLNTTTERVIDTRERRRYLHEAAE